MTIKLGVLISGSGTNLQAIIDAIKANQLDASIELVIASKSDAYGLVRAHEANIPTMALARDVYDDAERANTLIATEFRRAGCDYIVMAGYMRMVTEPLLCAFEDRIINIHPALLPSFPGAHGIADAYNAGVKVMGVTVHFANAAYDEGPIIAQRCIEVLESDTLEEVEKRIHDVEHVLYPHVLSLVADGRITIVTNEAGNRVVRIQGA
jgi:phosphoribosylglycinamide formyltransferase 1